MKGKAKAKTYHFPEGNCKKYPNARPTGWRKLQVLKWLLKELEEDEDADITTLDLVLATNVPLRIASATLASLCNDGILKRAGKFKYEGHNKYVTLFVIIAPRKWLEEEVRIREKIVGEGEMKL